MNTVMICSIWNILICLIYLCFVCRGNKVQCCTGCTSTYSTYWGYYRRTCSGIKSLLLMFTYYYYFLVKFSCFSSTVTSGHGCYRGRSYFNYCTNSMWAAASTVIFQVSFVLFIIITIVIIKYYYYYYYYHEIYNNNFFHRYDLNLSQKMKCISHNMIVFWGFLFTLSAWNWSPCLSVSVSSYRNTVK